MSTKRENILAAAVTALAGTTGVGSNIFRSRVVAFKRAEYPALNIEPINDTPTREAVGRLIWDLQFHVMVMVRADAADVSADPIVEDVHARLAADSTLQSMLVDLLPVGTDWQFVDADKQLCVVSMQYKVTYQTAETVLS